MVGEIQTLCLVVQSQSKPLTKALEREFQPHVPSSKLKKLPTHSGVKVFGFRVDGIHQLFPVHFRTGLCFCFTLNLKFLCFPFNG